MLHTRKELTDIWHAQRAEYGINDTVKIKPSTRAACCSTEYVPVIDRVTVRVSFDSFMKRYYDTTDDEP
jgi:hypothetical protein